MKAYLLEYNTKEFFWKNREEIINSVKNNVRRTITWSCSSDKVKIGDRIFIMRVGNDQGIFASGKCIKESFKAPHYDPEKAKKGETIDSIKIELDHILDPFNSNDEIITLDFLRNNFSRQTWTPPGGGIEIRESVYKDLEKYWARLIGIENDLYYFLKSRDELNPNSHDGSYELFQETINSYNTIDIDNVNFKDLDLIYLMCILFTNKNRNENLINNSNLGAEEKNRLTNKLDEVWNKAENKQYENIAKSPKSVGMFGTGFYTFDKSTTNRDLPRKIISLLLRLKDETDDNVMFDLVEEGLQDNPKGIGIPSLSVMLHCLKPNSFPIMNGNQGKGNVFELLGIPLSSNNNIQSYIENCRAIKQYRDENFTFKNYRIFDIVARMCDKSNDLILNSDYTFDDLNDNEGEKCMNDKIGLNTILFGPPGTGKTYNTKRYAVAICENKSLNEVNLMDYDNDIIPLYNKLVEQNRINFITFHQSYGYEEFIEGIKPIVRDNDVYYDVVPGIFKDFCEKAKKVDKIEIDFDDANIWKMSLYGGTTDIIQECFDENYIRIGFEPDSEDRSLNTFRNKMKKGDIVLSLKSFYEINGVGIVEGDVEELDNKSEYKIARKVKWLFKNKILNVKNINNGHPLPVPTCCNLPNIDRDSLFDLINDNTEFDFSISQRKPYVFIIDEINRGNISKIFGELITLIEDTKREGNSEASFELLPYSKKPFSVPNNVYLLGTMNTADRSISLIDTALRRRFNFVEMMPDTSSLDFKVQGLNIKEMIDKINERIEVLYDREHTIGHAFFTKLNENSTVLDLSNIFKNKIIPLLQEYFYEDYGKIRLVLGDNGKTDKKYEFINEIDNSHSDIFKGNFDRDLVENYTYEINNDAFMEIESYKQII